MKKTLSLLLLLSLVLSLASCGQKTTTDDPVAAATLAESYQSYLDTAEPSYAYDIALELTTNLTPSRAAATPAVMLSTPPPIIWSA